MKLLIERLKFYNSIIFILFGCFCLFFFFFFVNLNNLQISVKFDSVLVLLVSSYSLDF